MPPSARHIRLELAREPGHPHGDARAGYDIVAFLDDDGRLDLEACRDQAARCRVRRFDRDVTVATGRLRHTTGDRWLLDFPGGEREDATGFRLGEERFVPGEYVSIIDGDGTVHTYAVERVTEV
ncbi:hypothetical protein [uncultured Brevundimonas sp.]|uniref:hypothetical protein n=1 Tax=uncultured Brevundimonas sp. TaxID=213418 RepID=UPI0026254508|nr:hypothetical protein [uncultured Brevundimonas sp.]